MRRSFFQRLFSGRTLGWILSLALFAPIVAIIFAGLSTEVDEELQQHFVSVLLPRYTSTTLLLMVGVTAIAGLFGVTTAWLINVYEFPGRKFMAWALLLPFAVPAYLSAYAYVDFFQVTGPAFGVLRDRGLVDNVGHWWNVRHESVAVVVLAASLYVYFYLACTAALRRESPSLLEAARTLGVGGVARFRLIGLPLMRPAIAAGGLFVIFEVLNDFGAVDHFALDTFATGLYRAWHGYGEKALATRLALTFLLLALVIMLTEYVIRGRTRYAALRAPHDLRREHLSAIESLMAFGFCAVPLALGFLGPVSIFFYHLAIAAEGAGFTAYAPMAIRSLGLAAAASTCAVVVGGTIAWAFRREIEAQRRSASVKVLATLGYSISGSLVAIGILQLLPISVGYLILLLYALLARFSGIAVRNLEAGIEKVTPSMEGAARTLGANSWQVLTRVYAPLLAPALGSAWLLIFVDSVRELSATIILRPFDFQVLPIYIYNLASDERLADAAGAALLLIGLCLIPVWVLYRRIFAEQVVK